MSIEHDAFFSFYRPQVALPIKTGGEVLGVPMSIGKHRRGRPGKAGVDYQGHTGRRVQRRGVPYPRRVPPGIFFGEPGSSDEAAFFGGMLQRKDARKAGRRGALDHRSRRRAAYCAIICTPCRWDTQ
jgi:hypothetical protein